MTSASNPYQLPPARLDWDDSGAPQSIEFGDIYFSREGGLDETDYVFLQQNRLRERWQALDVTTPGVFVIAETGFGTGLNFLAAWQLWRDVAPPNWRLHFISAEQYPLSSEQLTQALALWPQLQTLSAALIANYPPLVRGYHTRQLSDQVTLQWLFDDAGAGFAALADSAAVLSNTNSKNSLSANNWTVDAWFLDGFAPAKNPDMWNAMLYAAIARLSRSGTTFATFTAAGHVRRDLLDLGFDVQKAPGHGKKHSILRGDWRGDWRGDLRDDGGAQQQPPAPKVAAIEYWARPPLPAQQQRVIVIGGGLAGTHTAYALARRGWPVTLLERSPALASGASGNPQGVLYTKLSAQNGALAQFALTSYLHALDHYRHLQDTQRLPASAAQWCGVLQMGVDARLREIFSGQADHSQWIRYVNAAEASTLTGVTVPEDALWFARAGWLRPAQVCAALASHPLIDVRLNCSVQALVPSHAGTGWLLQTTQGELHAGIVVIATAHDSLLLEPSAQLPLRAIRGQLTDVPAQWVAAPPRTVLCHEGYVVPSAAGALHIGATFDIDDADTALRADDHHRNLQSLFNALPSVLKSTPPDMSALTGRVGFRCTTPDYLPLVGAVADAPALRQHFAHLAHNARSTTAAAPAWQPGLYINAGHGSRGLTSTPLCAELLAAQICGEPPPLPRALWQALSPARFVLRDLIRGRAPTLGKAPGKD